MFPEETIFSSCVCANYKCVCLFRCCYNEKSVFRPWRQHNIFSLNIYNLLGNTIEDWNQGVVYLVILSKERILNYETGNAAFIYAQIVLFSFKGIYTMFRDTR